MHEIRIQLGGNPYNQRLRKVYDPEGRMIRTWNNVFLVTCLVSLFVDPLFFFLPSVRGGVMCIEMDGLLPKIFLTVTRSMVDILYAVQIYMRFHTAYAVSSTSVFGRPAMLVSEPSRIAAKYLKTRFLIDLIGTLPFPQVMIWGFSLNLSGSKASTKYVFLFLIACSYLTRLFFIFPPSYRMVKSTGVVIKTAWAGPALNLILCTLASHVLGACWFLQAIARQEQCWQYTCILERRTCQHRFFECAVVDDAARKKWHKSSNITNVCDPGKSDFPFGIYGEALTSKVTSSPFFNRYFYSLWWGLKNLSSLGQGLMTSTSIGEIVFAIIIAVLGLVMFGLLISNMQKYLQSTTIRVMEEWRTKRTDTDHWMRHRKLPKDLRESVRKYEQYKWDATRGVDEDAFLNGLPLDLHRQIKRHLCLHLIRRVPLFSDMNEMIQNLILERLKPILCAEGTLLLTEGHQVREMIFISRGHLKSFTTINNERRGLNSYHLGHGDFCGEQLLQWSLDPHPNVILPSSPRTVQAITVVEAFAITAEDLRYVTVHIKAHDQKRMRNIMRFHSYRSRTQAACLIQWVWGRYRRRINAVAR